VPAGKASSPSRRDGKDSAPAGRTTLFDIDIGLYRPGADRVPLRGVASGHNRYLIGRLAVTRDGDRATKIELRPIDDARARQAAQRRLFEERMNTARRSIDFGPVRTDGSFKLYKRQGALTLLPYPRDTAFHVELDLARLLPGAKPEAVRIEAFDAAGRSLGPVQAAANGSWLSFRAGLPGAARLEIRNP
jgi:hypothetical protein